MFGSGKVKELEYQLKTVREKLESAQREKADASQKLADAQKQISDLKTQLIDRDLEQLKEEAKAKIAEYEGLKKLYADKIQAFDASHEEKEQDFARESALKHFNLENEIQKNRQANREYVSEMTSTVR